MKVLVKGLGSIAQKHISAIKLINPSAKIYALRSNKPSDNIEGVTNIYSLKEVDSISLDFCIISSPTYSHKTDINHLLKLDIPLFIEKPLYHQLNLDDLLNNKKLKSIKTYVACNLRFLESLNYVKEHYLSQNSLKTEEVNVYCGSYLPLWRKNTDYKSIYSANQDMGGGVHLDLIHEIDYVYWLFGSPISTCRRLSSKSSIDINAVDYANYLLEYDSFYTSIILNYYRRDSKRTVEIVFDSYTVKVDLIKNIVYEDNQIVFSSNKNINDTYLSQMNYFMQNINSTNFNDIFEAFEVLKISLG